MADSAVFCAEDKSTKESYSDHAANLSYTARLDLSMERNLSTEVNALLPRSSSIAVDAPVISSDETPPVSVYIDMGENQQASNVHCSAPSTTVERHNPHPLPYSSQSQNRYPYVLYYERGFVFRRPTIPNGIEEK